MLRPDYEGGSIVNLMASLIQRFGGRSDDYAPLRLLDPELVRRHRNIVLLVVDGLGYDYLAGARAGATLRQHLVGRISSTFPTTTATAITTFLTGLAPQQHGLTGWYTWFKELGTVLTVLQARPRFGSRLLSESGVDVAAVLGHTAVFDRLSAPSYMVAPAYIAHSDFNLAHRGRAQVHSYEGLAQMFDRTAKLVRACAEPSYFYVYWPDLDRIAHEQGVGSEQAGTHLAEIDMAFARFLERIGGSDTLVIVTADHGIIDSAPQCEVDLGQHPAMDAMLALPLCGERRAAYCYVRPDSCGAFEEYVRHELRESADLQPSRELIEAGYFGHGTPHPRLHGRVGDYTLIMKGNCVVTERLPGERQHRLIGVHGGLSEQELYVPLVVVSC